MNKYVFFLLLCIFSFDLLAQTAPLGKYKTFKHPDKNCRSGSEEIILYNDGTFCVFSAIGGMAISYRGGWWVSDTLLVLHPSLNCAGPILLDKEESRDIGSNEFSIEIYNEKGSLKFYGCYDDKESTLKNIKSDGCVILNIREGVLFRHFDIVMKGKSLSGIKARKRNNKIKCVVLEPTSCDDVYWGKMTIPLRELEEIDTNSCLK